VEESHGEGKNGVGEQGLGTFEKCVHRAFRLVLWVFFFRRRWKGLIAVASGECHSLLRVFLMPTPTRLCHCCHWGTVVKRLVSYS